MKQLVSQTEFGVIYGQAMQGRPVSKQAVNQLIKRYSIPKYDGTKIDAQEALRIIAENSNPARRNALAAVTLTENYTYTAPSKPAPAAEPEDDEPEADVAAPVDRDSFAHHRTLHEQARAEMAQLQLKREMGRLLDKDEVERHVANIFRDLRDKALAVPQRIAGQVVTLATEREVAALMEDSLNATFAEFAVQLSATAGQHAG